ncbi:DUF3700 domain-containing protein [Citrus sinensis]|uniref:DUF3700 domain-containing protein n=1 Tax=Citrus sinensis TaxID=2711 RepID=A0A067G5E0_CITSI|nr:DUF3700 domain-containing protein [Citrus sinensis]KDO74779.1 hypothetical protein CISIN_1g026270mg [Citrus sinensis]
MLGVFSSAIVSPPEELVAAGSRTPSPKTTSTALVDRFLQTNSSAVSVQVGDNVTLAYTHQNESPLRQRSFAVKDEIFCLFEGALDNLGSLRQQYGLAKSANEVILVIEAYKALRDRAPYPPNHVVGHLSGYFAFIVYDKSTSTLTNLVRFLFIGESLLMDMLPLLMMLTCSKVLAASHLLLSLKVVSSQQQLED